MVVRHKHDPNFRFLKLELLIKYSKRSYRKNHQKIMNIDLMVVLLALISTSLFEQARLSILLYRNVTKQLGLQTTELGQTKECY